MIISIILKSINRTDTVKIIQESYSCTYSSVGIRSNRFTVFLHVCYNPDVINTLIRHPVSSNSFLMYILDIDCKPSSQQIGYKGSALIK